MFSAFMGSFKRNPFFIIGVPGVLVFYFFFMVGCASKIPNPDGPLGQSEPSVCEKRVDVEFNDGIKKRNRKVDFNYCFEQAESDDVLYYMHGAFGSETQFWKKSLTNLSFENFQDFKKILKDGKKMPKVFTVSLGNIWVLNDQGYSRKKGNDEETVKIFVEHIMPYLEKKHKIKDNPRRFLLGVSMGGQNAYQIGSQYPNHWAKVALVNAMFPLCIDPWNVLESLSCWRSQDLRVIGSMTMLMGAYESGDHWDKNNPLGAGAARITPNFPPWQHQYALADEFQFTKNDLAVCKAMSRIGVPSECVENFGGHGALNPRKLAEFFYPELKK